MRKIDKIIEGLQIFAKHKEALVEAQHDAIYAGPVGSGVGEISSDDEKRLKELGWFFDDSVDSWATFT